MDRSLQAARRWPAVVVTVCGGLVAFLGLVVIVGWHIGSGGIARVWPGTVMMHYFTAIGLALGGIGLLTCGLSIARRKRCPAALACGGLMALMGATLLLEYIFGWKLGFDQLLKLVPPMAGEVPLRPSPPTSVEFVLCGSALFMLGLGTHLERRRLVIWVLGSLALALSTMVLCGYVMRLPELYVWGRFVGMAPHTALGMFLLSAGLLTTQLLHGRRLINDRWLPVPVAVGMVTATLLLWQALMVDRHKAAISGTAMVAQDLATDALFRLEAPMRALIRMKQRWETRGGIPYAEWQTESRALLADESIFDAVEVADPSWHIRWAEPETVAAEVVGLDLREDTRWPAADTLALIHEHGGAAVSPTIQLRQGGQGFLVYLPLWVEGRFDGFLIGVFRFDRFVAALVNEPIFGPYIVSVREGDAPAPPPVGNGLGIEEQVDFYGHTWRFVVTPRKGVTAMSGLPETILGFGLLLAAAMVLVVRNHQKAIWQAWAEQSANRKLKVEISEREAMERLLRDSEERLHVVLNSATGVAVITAGEDGVITYFSKGAEEMLGYKAVEMVGKQSPAVFHDAREVWQRAAELSKELGRTVEGFDTFIALPRKKGSECREWTYVCKDGARRTVELTVTVLHGGTSGISGFLGTAVDITERKELERTLRQTLLEKNIAQAQLEAAGRIARLGHWFLALDGSGPQWSEMTYAIHEIPPGTPISLEEGIDFYDPEERPLVAQRVERAIRMGEEFDFEACITTRRGKRIRIHARGEPVRDDTGTVVALRGVFQDVNERHRAAELLEQRNRELEAATARAEAHARAKADFLANMSHEIRTPLNAVIGMSELLMDERLDGRGREFVETIHNSGDVLLALINDILDFSKIESGQLELEHIPVRLRDCVESALDIVAEPAARKHLDLIYWIDRDVPAAVLGDPTRLRQIIVNLASNAIKFTAQGEVFIKVSRAGDTGGQLRVAVRDTGIGIPTDRRDRLFHAFSQVDSSTTRRYGGTGLGLAISHRLVESMHGRIWVESVEGSGSTFYFEVPLEPVEMPVPAALGAAGIRSLKGLRVLIVDDNATNRSILQMQMEAWAMQPVAVDGSAAAMELIEKGDAFDLAILDVNMPDGDGYKLAETIRKKRTERELPIVLLSSMGDHRVNLKKLGIAGVLTKPVKITPLFNALRNVLAGPHRVAPLEVGHSGKLADLCPLRILVADDSAVNQRVTSLLLQRLGYASTLVSSGREALAALAVNPFDVVLLDVQMPDMDGLETARAICARHAHDRPWLVALTAHAVEGDREECLAAGMDDYLSKPVRTESLQSALRNAYAQKHQAELAARSDSAVG